MVDFAESLSTVLDSLDWHRRACLEVLSFRHVESPAILKVRDFNLPGVMCWGLFKNNVSFPLNAEWADGLLKPGLIPLKMHILFRYCLCNVLSLFY